jgi:hypothetical protein
MNKRLATVAAFAASICTLPISTSIADDFESNGSHLSKPFNFQPNEGPSHIVWSDKSEDRVRIKVCTPKRKYNRKGDLIENSYAIIINIDGGDGATNNITLQRDSCAVVTGWKLKATMSSKDNNSNMPSQFWLIR